MFQPQTQSETPQIPQTSQTSTNSPVQIFLGGQQRQRQPRQTQTYQGFDYALHNLLKGGLGNLFGGGGGYTESFMPTGQSFSPFGGGLLNTGGRFLSDLLYGNKFEQQRNPYEDVWNNYVKGNNTENVNV